VELGTRGGEVLERRLARSEVGVEAAVRQASLLHNVGDAGSVVTAAPDGASGYPI
jgi:hypothetical protein